MNQKRMLKYSEALDEALVQAMELDANVFVMGCGVDDEGGIFGTTRAAFKKFGKDRVIDAPLAENAMAGIGIGAAIMGKRPVIVHARNDFLLLASDQMINHAAKWRFMSGGKIGSPLLVRAIIGRGWGQAAQHSQSLQALFSHIPGMKVMLPASAYDAKGMLMAALKDQDPVLSIEHRLLYDAQTHVPAEPYIIPLGKGDIKRKGRDVTLVAFSYMVKEALAAAASLESEGIDVEVVDPRCSSPLDIELILDSVRKTKKVVVADTGWKSYGVTAEVCAQIYERAFSILEAPIRRVALPDQSTPCSAVLENEYYPGVEDLKIAVKSLVAGHHGEVTTRAQSAEHAKFQGPF